MNRDRIHLKAPGNWINDPNGFIYYNGEYHLFYQYFPYAPRWGTMHWGHAVSKDLTSWEHKGVALFPTISEDQNGCFSGSAIESDGRMYVYYTGVHYNKPDPDNIHICMENEFESAQLMICSEDGFQFDNFHGKRVVIPPIADAAVGNRTDTRDPKVWRGADAWNMLLGSTTEDRKGKLLFYRSENLLNWTFVNSISKESFGYMWECPDYFETEGGKVLVISPMGLLNDGKCHEEQSICTVVDFEEETCTMQIPDKYQFFDYGLDLYAPQSTVDEEGRRVIVAWLRMPEAVDGKWSGMFSIPRVVEVQGGHIYFRVHPNVDRMFTRRIDSASEASEAGYKVSLELKEGEWANIGGYRITRQDGKIHTSRTAVFNGHDDFRMHFVSPEVKEGNRLDIFVDPNMIEVFINQGEYVISNAVYGLSNVIQAECEGQMEIYTVE